ncbi:DUF5817 family protein [Halosimplex carlsbadense]|nr:hypothetical protein [Halosimplex carlsbadense]
MNGNPTHREKAEENVREHGTQHPETLLAAIMEEVGEISRAYLDATYFDEADPGDLDEEIDDLAALLVQLRWSVEDHPMAFEPFPTAEEIEERRGLGSGTDETDAVDVGLRQSKSDRSWTKDVLEIIEDLDNPPREAVIEKAEGGGIDEETAEHALSRLKEQGHIVKDSRNNLRRV